MEQRFIKMYRLLFQEIYLSETEVFVFSALGVMYFFLSLLNYNLFIF